MEIKIIGISDTPEKARELEEGTAKALGLDDWQDPEVLDAESLHETPEEREAVRDCLERLGLLQPAAA